MDHQDHLNLIRAGVPAGGGIWAELGSGSGHFTLALADLLGCQGVIYSLDKDRHALETQRQRLEGSLPPERRPELHAIHADYTRKLDLPSLDGVLMANALHYQRRKVPVLQDILGTLKPGGNFILVEYNTDRGNPWVPYPISYPTWEALAERAGFSETRLLSRVRSSFLGEIYSALSVKPGLKDTLKVSPDL